MMEADLQLIQNVITEAGKAENYTKQFMHEFYRETFGEELTVRDKFFYIHHDFIKDFHNKLGKSLGEVLSSEDLEQLKFSETLPCLCAGIQLFEIAFKHIVEDQLNNQGKFHEHFDEVAVQLKPVLAELNDVKDAAIDKIEDSDVPKVIADLEKNDRSERNVRHWIILRDYVNTLEYIQQALQYFLNNSEQLPSS